MRVEELEEVRPSQPAAPAGPVGVDFGVVGVGVLEHAEGGPAFGVRILDIEYGTDAQVVVVDPAGDERAGAGGSWRVECVGGGLHHSPIDSGWTCWVNLLGDAGEAERARSRQCPSSGRWRYSTRRFIWLASSVSKSMRSSTLRRLWRCLAVFLAVPVRYGANLGCGAVFGYSGVERFDVVPGEAPDPVARVADAASFSGVAGDVLVFFGGVELEPVEVDGDIGTGSVNAAEHKVGGGGR